MRDLIHIRGIRLLLLAVSMLFLSTASFAQVGVSVSIAPPELPVYDQPICPGDGYIWTPGYWAWDGEYYWVPGTWVLAPEAGYLWTPGYWGWGGSGFIFYDGYWGPSVGFYGGIDYGYGYFGHGYEGGRWDHGHFFYNTAVNHVDPHVIHNVYNTRVNENASHVSYNGGNGGINERPTAQEEAAAHDRHIPPVGAQTQHAYAAHNNPQQRFPRTTAHRQLPQRPAPTLQTILRSCRPSNIPLLPTRGTRSWTRNTRSSRNSNREANPGTAKSPAEAGQAQHQQLAKTKRQSGKNAASGTATPATDAAIAAKAHAANATDATETGAGWRRISRRRASLIEGLPFCGW
jgi:hypothetical protein